MAFYRVDIDITDRVHVEFEGTAELAEWIALVGEDERWRDSVHPIVEAGTVVAVEIDGKRYDVSSSDSTTEIEHITCEMHTDRWI